MPKTKFYRRCLVAITLLASITLVVGCEASEVQSIEASRAAKGRTANPYETPVVVNRGVTAVSTVEPDVSLSPTMLAEKPQIDEPMQTNVELVKNGSFRYWNDDKGLPAGGWQLMEGRIERDGDITGGTTAAKLTPSAEGRADLRIRLELPDGVAGQTLRLSLNAKAPANSLRVFLLGENGRLGRLLPQTTEESYKNNPLNVLLPTPAPKFALLQITATLETGQFVSLDAVSVEVIED